MVIGVIPGRDAVNASFPELVEREPAAAPVDRQFNNQGV